MTVELLQQFMNKTLEQKTHVKQRAHCHLYSSVALCPTCWMIPRIETGVLELLSGCTLIFQGIYLWYEGHMLSCNSTHRMQKVMSRNSIAITITLQDCQATEEIRHTTTYFSNDCFIDLKATMPSQVSLVCLCILSFCYCADSVSTVSQKRSCQVYWEVKRWWYIHFWGLGLLMMATVIHLICFKYILPQCLTDWRGIDSLRSRRFSFSEDMFEIEN